VLTVRAGQAYSHKGQGWEILTDKIISLIKLRIYLPKLIYLFLFFLPASLLNFISLTVDYALGKYQEN
jgi:uracil DNA glycosylase